MVGGLLSVQNHTEEMSYAYLRVSLPAMRRGLLTAIPALGGRKRTTALHCLWQWTDSTLALDFCHRRQGQPWTGACGLANELGRYQGGRSRNVALLAASHRTGSKAGGEVSRTARSVTPERPGHHCTRGCATQP